MNIKLDTTLLGKILSRKDVGQTLQSDVSDAVAGEENQLSRATPATGEAAKIAGPLRAKLTAAFASRAEGRGGPSPALPDRPTDYAAGGVVHFGKERLVVGLDWQLYDKDLGLKEQAATLNDLAERDPNSSQPPYDLYVDAKNTSFVAFGSTEAGHRNGMRALVTAISRDRAKGNWIGVFPISQDQDIWWIGAARDGKVFQDTTVAGRKRALEAFMSDLQAPEWEACQRREPEQRMKSTERRT